MPNGETTDFAAVANDTSQLERSSNPPAERGPQYTPECLPTGNLQLGSERAQFLQHAIHFLNRGVVDKADAQEAAILLDSEALAEV